MTDQTTRIYNSISIVFLVLTVLTLVGVIVLMAAPAPDDEPVDVLGGAALPERFVTPTPTITPTPSPTVSPTATPIPTNTPIPSDTPIPTNTPPPSPTITNTPGPTNTPSLTPTPSISPTPTPSATPTGPSPTPTPTESPYLFDLRAEVVFQSNTGNVFGCNWQGVAGSVLNQSGAPTTQQYRIRVFNNFFEGVAVTGQNTYYDPTSGWEVRVSDATNGETYFVHLETVAGTQISDDVQVTFPNSCDGNVAIVRFIQVRDFGG